METTTKPANLVVTSMIALIAMTLSVAEPSEVFAEVTPTYSNVVVADGSEIYGQSTVGRRLVQVTRNRTSPRSEVSLLKAVNRIERRYGCGNHVQQASGDCAQSVGGGKLVRTVPKAADLFQSQKLNEVLKEVERGSGGGIQVQSEWNLPAYEIPVFELKVDKKAGGGIQVKLDSAIDATVAAG